MRYPLTLLSPSDCPFCKQPLENIFQSVGPNTEAWYKFCKSMPNHKIQYIHDLTSDYLTDIRVWLDIANEVMIDWNYENRILSVWYRKYKGEKLSYQGKPVTVTGKVLYLPWFEPDLSNHQELINKIKTYVLFS